MRSMGGTFFFIATLALAMPEGTYRIDTIDKRIRFEENRAIAVDGWQHAIVFPIRPGHVVYRDLVANADGSFTGRDTILNGPITLTPQPDGTISARVRLFLGGTSYSLVPEGSDTPAPSAGGTELAPAPRPAPAPTNADRARLMNPDDCQVVGSDPETGMTICG